jgi:hypothetical protein
VNATIDNMKPIAFSPDSSAATLDKQLAAATYVVYSARGNYLAVATTEN